MKKNILTLMPCWTLMVLAALLFMCVKSDVVGDFFTLLKNIF